MIASYEIETAVLSRIGAGIGLTSKEQEVAVRAAVRDALFDAVSGKVRVELIKPPDGSARDGAATTDRPEEREKRKSAPRRR